MHVDDLEQLISLEHDNIVALVNDATGVDINKEPATLLVMLREQLATSRLEGVSYNDVSKLKQFTALEAATKYLNPGNYSFDRTLVGVQEYQTVLRSCIDILEDN